LWTEKYLGHVKTGEETEVDLECETLFRIEMLRSTSLEPSLAF